MRHPPLQDSTASLYTFVSENRQMPPAVCCARSSSPLGPPPRVRPFSQLAGPRRPRPPCPKTARPAAWWTSPLAVLPGPKLSTCRLERTPAPPGHSSERGYAAAEIARVGNRTPPLPSLPLVPYILVPQPSAPSSCLSFSGSGDRVSRTAGLNNRNLFSHKSGGRKSQVTVSAGMVSSGASLLGSQVAVFLLFFCMALFPNLTSTAAVGLKSTLMTFDFTSSETLSPNIVTFCGPGGEDINVRLFFRGRNSTPFCLPNPPPFLSLSNNITSMQSLVIFHWKRITQQSLMSLACSQSAPVCASLPTSSRMIFLKFTSYQTTSQHPGSGLRLPLQISVSPLLALCPRRAHLPWASPTCHALLSHSAFAHIARPAWNPSLAFPLFRVNPVGNSL